MTDQLTTLAQRVKKLRLERGWSQAQLAEKIGANPSVIGNIERRNSKSTEYAEQLADVLEVDLAWLLTGKGAAIDFLPSLKQGDSFCKTVKPHRKP